MESTSQVLTVQEVARFLRVTPKTVYALVRRGELLAFRVGRALRCRDVDVRRFIQEQPAAGAPDSVGQLEGPRDAKQGARTDAA